MKPGEWAAIVGWGRDGRGELTREVVAAMRARGLKLGGCLQRALREDGEIIGYDLVDLEDGRRYPLARPSAEPELCNWGFDERVFAELRARLLGGSYDLIVLELGPIEARGRGHWETISAILAREGPPLLLCIRPRVLARIALELPEPAHGLELPASAEAVAAFVEELAAASHQIEAARPQQRS